MKKIIYPVLSFIIALGMLCSCGGDPYVPDKGETSDGPLSSWEDDGYWDDYWDDSDFGDDSDYPVPPSLKDDNGDLATCGAFVSRAPDNYGMLAELIIQEELVSEDSTSALMGIFNPLGEDVHEGYMIWTFADFCVEEYYNRPLNLANKQLVFDVLMINGGIYSSFILVDSQGEFSTEITFEYASLTNYGWYITCERLDNGWMRITLDFSSAFSKDSQLFDVSHILITFGNEDCDFPGEDSMFFIDNMHIVSAR